MSLNPARTLVVGASENPARYSNHAIKMLRDYNEPVAAFGVRAGEVAGVRFETDWEAISEKGPFETITLYVGPRNQAQHIEPILALEPRRVIFNPGTENPVFIEQLRKNGIEPILACTLVMLRTGQYAVD